MTALPSSVVLVGRANALVVNTGDPDYRQIRAAGRFVVACPKGRVAWLTRALGPAELVRQLDGDARKAAALRSSITGRAAALTPAFLDVPEPDGYRRELGQLVIIAYTDQRQGGPARPVVWEHYFAPASQPMLIDCGYGRYEIARGSWRLTARGFEDHKEA